MKPEEIKKILKEHLSIEIYQDYDAAWDKTINVCVRFDEEDICSSSTYIY